MVSEIGGGDMPPGMEVERYAAMLDRRAERMALMQAEIAEMNHPVPDTASEDTVQPAVVAQRIVIEHRADAGWEGAPPKFQGYGRPPIETEISVIPVDQG